MKIPILRLKDVLLTSIQEDLTDEDIMRFQEDVARTVVDEEARGIVIDITALDTVDSFMARAINDTGSIVRLLGAEVVVCGIRPSVAMTLVEMGRGLIGVGTTFNLDQGLRRIRELIALRPDGGVDGDADERA